MRQVLPYFAGAVLAAVLQPVIGQWVWLAIALAAAIGVLFWLLEGDPAARLAALFMLGFCRIAPWIWPDDFAHPKARAELDADERTARAVLAGRET
jgi:hypothetical protein